jgi:hypothetical protein
MIEKNVEKDAAFRKRRAADTARWRERLHRGAVQKHIEIAEPSKNLQARAPCGPRRRWLALGQPSVQFRWLIVLAVSSGRCVDARLQARKAGVGLRSKIRKHLAVASFDLGENFIDARKHAPDNLDHLAPQNVEFAAQPLDVALAPFTAHRTSSQNCSNSARNSNDGPQEPSDSTGVAV